MKEIAMPDGDNGIRLTLQVLARMAWRDRVDPKVYDFADRVTRMWSNRHDKMEAIVDALHRRFAFGQPDPSAAEAVTTVARLIAVEEGMEPRPSIDADEAALFVAAAAMAVGIPCRIVGVRYGQAWTCRVDYEVGDHWAKIDPLQQDTDRVPDEEVTAPLIVCDNCGADCTADYLAGGGKNLCPPCGGQKPIWEPIKMNNGHHEEELPGGVQLEVRNKTTYHVDRTVTLSVTDPDAGIRNTNLRLEATVTASVSSYESVATTPRLQFSSHVVTCTRKQWEAMKRLGDQAWAEYEKRFPQE